MKSSILIVGTLFLFGAVLAQQGEPAPESAIDEAEEAVRHYTAEIIIFSYAEDISVGSEVFVPRIILPDPPADSAGDEDDGEDEDAEDDREQAPADDDIRPVYPFSYERLSADELTMADIWAKLELLDAYQPLMHFGWTQPTIDEDQTPMLTLQRFGRPPQGLDGSLKLSLSRFLHLDIDISLAAPEADPLSVVQMRSTETGARVVGNKVFGDERVQNADGYEPMMLQYAPARFRISERRIMKNGDIRYFDHPKFGVIAKIARFEKQDDVSGPSTLR